MVAFGGLLLLGGRLSDLFGPRRLFAIGFAVLTVASLIAGIATTGATLLIARAVQGAGAALIAPAALSMVMALFAARPAELRKALGFWGASAAAGGTAGVFLGGVITEWLSWRWTFLINVPIGALVLFATNAWLPRGVRQRGSVDLAGAFTVTAALALAVYSIVTANEPGNGARTALLLAISGALFVTFAVLQRVRKAPLVPLAIFTAPNLTAGNVVMALLGAAWIPMWFFLNMYLQEVLGYGAFDSGLALLPMTLAIMLLMMTTTEKVVGRIGPKSALVIGLGVLGLALVLFSRMSVDGSFVADVLLPSLLGAIGMSLAYIPAMITSTASARREDGGLASGLVNTTYQVGSAIGLAAMVAVAGAKTTALVEGGADSVVAMNDGFSAAFIGAGAIAFVAAVLAGIAVRVPRANIQRALVAVLVLGAALGACKEQSSHATHSPTQPESAPAPELATPTPPTRASDPNAAAFGGATPTTTAPAQTRTSRGSNVQSESSETASLPAKPEPPKHRAPKKRAEPAPRGSGAGEAVHQHHH